MRALTRHTGALLAAVLLPVSLSACDGGGDPEPTFTDSSSAASTESGTATDEPTSSGPAEPTLPAAAEKGTKEGAEAFVRYYVELINYAQKTGDVVSLAAAGLAACDACDGGVKAITDVYERGGRIIGDSYSVSNLDSVESPNRPGTWVIAARLKVGRQSIRDAGDLNKTYEPTSVKVIFTVNQYRGRWGVSSWDRQ